MALLMQADTINAEKLVIDQFTIEGARKADKVPILINDEKRGMCYMVAKPHKNAELMGYFTLYGDVLDEPSAYIALPQFKAKILVCAICGRSYERRDIACPCIFRAPVLILREITLMSVIFLDARLENIEKYDARPTLIRRHFSGAMGGVVDE